jgi:type I restriction enzyme, R subunit
VIEKKFSERLQAALNRYRSRAVESAQVIEELIGMAKEFRDAANRGEKLGLNDSELAFYDALAENDSAVRELGDEKADENLRVRRIGREGRSRNVTRSPEIS